MCDVCVCVRERESERVRERIKLMKVTSFDLNRIRLNIDRGEKSSDDEHDSKVKKRSIQILYNK